MASISSNTKNSCHTRSISLPSTLHKPSLFDKFQEATTSSSSSSSSSIISHKINGLNDMFESIETLLTLSSTQRFLGDGCHKEEMNDLLDELLVLLDLCSTTKDALYMSNDAVKELQSVFRRKRGDSDGLTSSVRQYLSQRKNVRNLTQKAISRLKKQAHSPIKEKGTTSDINLLKDVRPNTLMIFESLLTFILGSSSLAKPMVWFSVSKKLCNKRVAQCNQMVEKDEMKKVDDEIIALFSHKDTNKRIFDVEIIYKSLSELEFSLQNLHEHVECVFRHLIKTRVCLLNKFTC